MKAIRMVALACALPSTFVLAGTADNFERGYQLAERKGCFDCHALGYKDVGPSFRAIAQRYGSDPEHQDRLPYIIRGGSVGHWGERFIMWPQVRLTNDEVDELVAWILSQY
jgi:cytochrome c